MQNITSEDALYQTAVELYQKRNFAEAEKTLTQILAQNPKHAHSLHLSAAIGYNNQRYDLAERLARQAIAEEKNAAAFYYTLGLIHSRQGKFEETLSDFKKVTELQPNHLDAIYQSAQIYLNQGISQKNNEMIQAALDCLKKALAIRPDENTYLNISYILQLQGNHQALIETGEACFALYPNSVRNLLGLAGSYNHLYKYEEALKYYKKALTIEPGNGVIHAHMASTLKELGLVDESISMQKKALELLPDQAWIYSNMLLSMVYAASVSPEELADTARLFGQRIADPLIRKRPFQNDKSLNRKLRIGYVSADFRAHPVSFFLAPVYHCNKQNFEIFAYSKTQNEDSVTHFMKPLFDGWRDIKFLDDDQTADIIENDKIDILVDLAGHTGNNSLPVFARKPAPVQVSWLGYPATTGMQAMDYRITDPYAEPPGTTEQLNVEKLWRLPDIFCSYISHPNSPAVTDHPPFEDKGYITFGCFNNFTKVTGPVLQTWAKILDQVPNSKLLLEIGGIDNDKTKAEILTRLTQHGFSPDRLILEQRSPANQYVLYNRIDIALDPFPCNGGTTSFDTLWMGVPFVSLEGRHFVSRMGVTILTNAGLSELIAQNEEEYIKTASALANDRERLKKLRRGLREKFAASPAMDQQRFARNMETAYREMWKKWVETTSRE